MMSYGWEGDIAVVHRTATTQQAGRSWEHRCGSTETRRGQLSRDDSPQQERSSPAPDIAAQPAERRKHRLRMRHAHRRSRHRYRHARRWP